MTLYYKIRQILLQNATVILLQNATEVYYKMRQFYYKMRQLLQITTFITNCDSTSFEALLEKDASVSIPNRNLQILATEMYKIKNELSPLIVTDLFEQRKEQH